MTVKEAILGKKLIEKKIEAHVQILHEGRLPFPSKLLKYFPKLQNCVGQFTFFKICPSASRLIWSQCRVKYAFLWPSIAESFEKWTDVLFFKIIHVA